MVFFSSPDIETTMPTFDAPQLLNPTLDHCNINSETNSELELDNYPVGKIFKNTEKFQCKLSYSFELPAQENTIAYLTTIPEDPPDLLPLPEPLPLTFVSPTTITIKWGDNYQEWGESNSTHC